MPRDLEEEKPAPAVPLTESPNRLTESLNKPEEIEPIEATEYQRSFTIVPKDQQYTGPTNLHPYTRPLTISDLESVVALENAAFPDPNERATREKVSQRCNQNGRVTSSASLSSATTVTNSYLVDLQAHQVQ